MTQTPSEQEQQEIEAERQRRLSRENRPDNAEVDNTGTTLPTVEAFREQNTGGEGVAGTADPSRFFREHPPTDDEVAEIEAERQRRLAPENRPDNAEVDNTGNNKPGFARD